MATAPDPLDALRPLRLPPAPESSLVETLALATAVGVAAALGLVLLVAAWRTFAAWRAPRREALAALARAALLPPAERLAAEARLLRAYAARIAGAEAARLQGTDWLRRLDATFATTFFTAADGRMFGEWLYRPIGDADPPTSADLRRLLRRRRR